MKKMVRKMGKANSTLKMEHITRVTGVKINLMVVDAKSLRHLVIFMKDNLWMEKHQAMDV